MKNSPQFRRQIIVHFLALAQKDEGRWGMKNVQSPRHFADHLASNDRVERVRSASNNAP